MAVAFGARFVASAGTFTRELEVADAGSAALALQRMEAVTGQVRTATACARALVAGAVTRRV